MGFTFDDAAARKGASENLETMRSLILKDKRNSERIFPYIGGEEVNNSPTHSHHRHVINFSNFPLRRDPQLTAWRDASDKEREIYLQDGIVPIDYNGPVSEDWHDLLRIVEARVKPERQGLPPTNSWNKTVSKRWWLWGAARIELNKAIDSLRTCLFIPNVAPHLTVARISSKIVVAAPHNVLAFDDQAAFAILQSRPHEVWTRFFASSMKDDLRYTPSDCFETFPFPLGFETAPALEAAGQAYHDHRAALMIARNEGMTKTYNRFHDCAESAEDIRILRDLHAAMDRAVLVAYGWDDLAERAQAEWLDEDNEPEHTYQNRFFWPSAFRDEVLARLLALNAERATAERVAGLTAAPAEADDEDAA